MRSYSGWKNQFLVMSILISGEYSSHETIQTPNAPHSVDIDYGLRNASILSRLLSIFYIPKDHGI